MKLKICPKCSVQLTTKNVYRKRRNELGLYFNCKACHSTAMLRVKNWKELILKESA